MLALIGSSWLQVSVLDLIIVESALSVLSQCHLSIRTLKIKSGLHLNVGAIPEEESSMECKGDGSGQLHTLPAERVLGVQWCVKSDSSSRFQSRIDC